MQNIIKELHEKELKVTQVWERLYGVEKTNEQLEQTVGENKEALEIIQEQKNLIEEMQKLLIEIKG